MKKKDIRKESNEFLIHRIAQLEMLFSEMFRTSVIDFNFSNESFYKKFDTDNVKKIKNFVAILDDFLTIIQELRSRDFSLIEIADMESVQGFLQRSFSEKL